MATPANIQIDLEFQDNRGFRANSRINMFEADVTADAGVISAIYTAVAAVAADVANMSNAKLIQFGWTFTTNYAQEPSAETGTYQLVMQKARLDFGDGNGGFQHLSIPAPKDALFLPSADNNLVVVDPASPLLEQLQDDTSSPPLYLTARGGTWGSQFFGGQLVQGKPRRRRVLQGQ